MSTHQFNSEMLPDSFFVGGELKHLVVGNECRLLDQRRTPGIIKSIDIEAGFFRWEISDFEDKGKFWDIEFERVNTYQFKTKSAVLSDIEVAAISRRIQILNIQVEVNVTEINKFKTNENVALRMMEVEKWINEKSSFFSTQTAIDFQSLTGPPLLRNDFNLFMSDVGLHEVELRTAETQVMNPHSGDWIIAMQIIMAEMGLKSYSGRAIRSKSVFEETGCRTNRTKYIEYRLAFMRVMFNRLGIKEVELYRGMSTENEWNSGCPKLNRFWSSWTFNHKVALDFTELNPGTKQNNSYLIKRAMPVERLFMTFLETDAMNKQYLEAEAIVLHDENDRWM